MHDYATSVLAFAAAARLAVHRRRPEGGGPPAHAGDAGPSGLHVRAAVPRRARPAAAGQGVLAPSATHTTARHLLREIDDILLHRPALGALVDEVAELPPDPHVERASGSGRRVAADARRSCGCCPYLQTHLTIREIGERLFVSRNTVSSEVGSIYRKLGVSSRSDAVRQATAIGLLGG